MEIPIALALRRLNEKYTENTDELSSQMNISILRQRITARYLLQKEIDGETHEQNDNDGDDDAEDNIIA